MPEGLLCGTRLNFDVRPSVRTMYGRFFGSFMLADRHVRQDFWTHMFKQNLKRRKIGQKKTEFKQERNDRPKNVFEKNLKNFTQAMDARKKQNCVLLYPYVRGKTTQNFTFSTREYFRHVRLTCVNKFKRDRTKALRATLAPRV